MTKPSLAYALALVVLTGCQEDNQPVVDAAPASDSSPDARPDLAPIPCDSPLLDDTAGTPTGLVLCEAFTAFRVESPECPAYDGSADCAVDLAECSDHDDCTEGPDPRCVKTVSGCGCLPGCTTDAICGPGAACLCRSRLRRPTDEGPLTLAAADHSRCVRADCRVDADCAPYRCGVSLDGCRRADGLYCRTAADECARANDCDLGDLCAYDRDAGRWRCRPHTECMSEFAE